MYFTHSDLYKTLCLTLICNIQEKKSALLFLYISNTTCTGKYNGFVRENILNKHKSRRYIKKQTLHNNPPLLFLHSLQQIRGILAR